jgi:hypothetical protein
MGLDVVMVGLNEIKDRVNKDVGVTAMVKWLQENVPAAHTTNIGEPSGPMSGGHRIGMYSDLHVLRGLALRFEQQGAPGLAGATEDELYALSEAFYETDPPAPTRFNHLINHSDADGIYIPLPLPEPVYVTGSMKLTPDDEEEEINLSIGSSEELLRELDELAPVIGLSGDLGSMTETEFELAVAETPWPTAAHVWGLLHWYARESVRGKTLIQFC